GDEGAGGFADGVEGGLAEGGEVVAAGDGGDGVGDCVDVEEAVLAYGDAGGGGVEGALFFVEERPLRVAEGVVLEVVARHEGAAAAVLEEAAVEGGARHEHRRDEERVTGERGVAVDVDEEAPVRRADDGVRGDDAAEE